MKEDYKKFARKKLPGLLEVWKNFKSSRQLKQAAFNKKHEHFLTIYEREKLIEVLFRKLKKMEENARNK